MKAFWGSDNIPRRRSGFLYKMLPFPNLCPKYLRLNIIHPKFVG